MAAKKSSMVAVELQPLSKTEQSADQSHQNKIKEFSKSVHDHGSWVAVAKLSVLWIAGIVFASGHHLFYQYLDGKAVMTNTNGIPTYMAQEWVGKYGVAFAFITKTFLATAVVIAYEQHAWASFREKTYKISTINAIFTAPSNILGFSNSGFVFRSKISATLAALAWTIPLTALITPPTLLVVSSSRTNMYPRGVPTLQFLSSSGYGALNDPSPYYLFGAKNDISPLLARTTSATANTNQIIAMSINEPNSSYSLQFYGPSLKCSKSIPEVAKLISLTKNATLAQAHGNADASANYIAFTPYAGDISYNSGGRNSDGIAVNNTNWNATWLAKTCVLEATDPCTWSGSNYTGLVPSPSAMQFILLLSLGRDQLACSVQNTSYHATFSSNSAIRSSIFLDKFEHLGESQHAMYAHISQAIADLLAGAVGSMTSRGAAHSDGFYTTVYSRRTRILETGLIGAVAQVYPNFNIPQADTEMSRNSSIGSLIEELSRNQTLSLFSQPRFWAKETKVVNITQEVSINVWQYQPRNLWIAYGLAILAASFGIIVGLAALYKNGRAHDFSFLTTLAATRNRSLDELMAGSAGGKFSRDEVLATKLRLGLLEDWQAVHGDVVFGLPEEISRTRRL